MSSLRDYQFVENFLKKIGSKEYEIDESKAKAIPYEGGTLFQKLIDAVERYQREKSASAARTPTAGTIDNIVTLIYLALLHGVIITAHEKSSKQNSRSSEQHDTNSYIEQIIRELNQKETQQQQSTVYNIQDNVGDVFVGNRNLKTDYDNTIKQIKEDTNIPEEKKSRAMEVLAKVRKYSETFTLIYNAIDAVRKFLPFS
jgi:RecG-like helicase